MQVYLLILDTPRHDIEEAFRGFLKRDDIAIVLINQTVSIKVKLYSTVKPVIKVTSSQM